jgi:hypothetical protein
MAAADLAPLAGALLVLRMGDASVAATLAASAGRAAGASAGPGEPPTGPEAALRPAVTPDALLSLGRGEFVLAVNAPQGRLVELGRLVPARLPRYAAAPAERRWRRLRYDPA